jgi:hypothetical protein
VFYRIGITVIACTSSKFGWPVSPLQEADFPVVSEGLFSVYSKQL